MEILKFKENSFICSYKGGLKTCSYEELLAVECDKPLIKFRLDKCLLIVRGSLSSIEKSLPAYFIRINRWVIVNMKLAVQIIVREGNFRILLPSKIEYQISERRRREVHAAFLLYA